MKGALSLLRQISRSKGGVFPIHANLRQCIDIFPEREVTTLNTLPLYKKDCILLLSVFIPGIIGPDVGAD